GHRAADARPGRTRAARDRADRVRGPGDGAARALRRGLAPGPAVRGAPRGGGERAPRRAAAPRRGGPGRTLDRPPARGRPRRVLPQARRPRRAPAEIGPMRRVGRPIAFVLAAGLLTGLLVGTPAGCGGEPAAPASGVETVASGAAAE